MSFDKRYLCILTFDTLLRGNSTGQIPDSGGLKMNEWMLYGERALHQCRDRPLENCRSSFSSTDVRYITQRFCISLKSYLLKPIQRRCLGGILAIVHSSKIEKPSLTNCVHCCTSAISKPAGYLLVESRRGWLVFILCEICAKQVEWIWRQEERIIQNRVHVE